MENATLRNQSRRSISTSADAFRYSLFGPLVYHCSFMQSAMGFIKKVLHGGTGHTLCQHTSIPNIVKPKISSVVNFSMVD